MIAATPEPCPTYRLGDPDTPRAQVRVHCVRDRQPHPPWSSAPGSPLREHMAVVNGATIRWSDR